MRYPYFRLFPKDFLGDNIVDSMTAEELGGYWRLLLVSWQEDPAASLPPDEGQLARWAKLDTARWSACRERILSCFVKGRDGRLYQKRLRAEYEHIAGVSEARAESGRKGGRGNKSNCKAFAKANGKQLEKQTGSGSECVSSNSQEGGPGETRPPPTLLPDFDDTAEGLAQLWCFHQIAMRGGVKRDKVEDAEAVFTELLRLGWTAAFLRAEILRKDRDRTEYLWQFKKRLPVKPAKPADVAIAERQEKLKAQREKAASEQAGKKLLHETGMKLSEILKDGDG